MKRGAPKSDPEKVRAFVERGRRSSAESLSPSETKRRKPMKRSQPKRCWIDAQEKMRAEGGCRICGVSYPCFEAAHVVGREHDKPHKPGWLWVNPDSVVPLCRPHHRQYDPHMRGLDEQPLDLLPHLTGDEKRQALEDLDWDVIAFLHRTTGCRWAPEKEAA